MINFEALFKISYGLYIVSSGNREKGNGFISNTVFQVTSQPPRFAACCSKNNYTAGLIQSTGAFAVSILEQDTPPEILGTFGFKSGREADKMQGMNLLFGQTGVPVVLDSAIAWLEIRVEETIDAGSHLLFLGSLLNAEILEDSKEPLTYGYYRQVKKGTAPENAPTYVDKSLFRNKPSPAGLKSYKCSVCAYIYDEALEEVRFRDLPENWVCPVCGTDKADFIEMDSSS